MAQSNLALFMTQLLRRPHQVVALAPSSPGLCAEMARGLDPAGGPIIELGAGTGNITRAMLDLGIAPERIHAVEMNPEFCTRLSDSIPGLNVLQMSAGDIGGLPIEDAQAVVSGLPLLSMPVALQRSILTGAVKCLAPGAPYVQFTYGPKPPVTRAVREELDLTWEVSPKIWRNIPPARVYRFRAQA